MLHDHSLLWLMMFYPLYPDSPYRQAAECFHNRDYEDIVQLCSMEINLSSASHMAEAMLLRATFYLLRGEGNKAMEDFDNLLGMDVDKRVSS